MLQLLPYDIIVHHICPNLSIVNVDALLTTCKDLFTITQHTDVYRILAHHWHGRDFWQRAIARPTRRRFVSMRDELWKMHIFECHLECLGHEKWDVQTYYCFWRCEAAALLKCPM